MFGFMKAYNYNIEHYNSSENGKKRDNRYPKWFLNDCSNNDKRKYIIGGKIGGRNKTTHLRREICLELSAYVIVWGCYNRRFKKSLIERHSLCHQWNEEKEIKLEPLCFKN